MSNSNTGFNFTGHHNERLLDILAVFGGCLKEANVIMLCEFLALVGGDLAGVGHIALVANEDARDVVRGVLLNLAHPVLDGAEALSVGDVVGHDDSVSALVVAAGDGLEALLAGGVPNLELNGLSVDIDGPDFLQTWLAREGGTYEVDSDCGHEVVCEHVVGESEQQGGLSDSGVSNQQHLEEVVAIVSCYWDGASYYSGFIFAEMLVILKIIICISTVR